MGIKNGGFLLVILLFISALLFSIVSNAAGESKNLSIMQIESNLPDLDLYLRFDNIDMDSAKLIENLTITINDTPAKISAINPVTNGETAENTAYLFLVDTSNSMNRAQINEQTKMLLEKLLANTATNDQTAVWAFSNRVEVIKDFNVTASPQAVAQNVVKLISSQTIGTYLYSGILDAIDKFRNAENIAKRRIIVVITDLDEEYGDSFNKDDIKKQVEVDRLPVYTLIVNKENSVDQEAKFDVGQISQMTGGQLLFSTKGDELFTGFQRSVDQSSIVKLRIDDFNTNEQYAVISVGLRVENSEIRTSAKFTVKQANLELNSGENQDQTQGKIKSGQPVIENKQKQASLFNLRNVLIAVTVLLVLFLLTLLWFLKTKSTMKKLNGYPDRIRFQASLKTVGAEMLLQKPQVFSGKISLQVLVGPQKGSVIEIQPDQNPLIGSTPECGVCVGNGHKVFGSVLAINDIVVIQSKVDGNVFVNGSLVQGSHILENGDLVRVAGMMFRVIM